MTRTMWKRFGIGAAALAVVGSGIAMSLPSSDAAISVVVKCKGDKSHLFELLGFPPFNVQTTGFLDAGVGSSFVTTDGRKGINLSVEGLSSSGQVEAVGGVTFNLDNRPAGPSFLVANQTGSSFPATQTMRFHFTVSTDAGTFRSINAATVTSSDVRNFPPPSGTEYVLTNQVRLEDVDNPGQTAGTLAPGKAFTIH